MQGDGQAPIPFSDFARPTSILKLSIKYFVSAFIALLLFCGRPIDAIENATPLKPPDTRSPQSTMKVFMDSMQRAYQKSLRLGFKHEEVYVHLNRAAKCFDLSAIAPNVVQDVGEQINNTGGVLTVVKISLRILLFVASGWAIIVIGNGIAEFIITSKRAFARTIDANLVRLITRLVTLVLLFVLLWNTCDYLGMSFTAVFASAGIVGLGVALAARETLANFFGGISIFLDRPFKSGDYIVLDSGERGRVVEMGMRSTRILTRDDIMISIPNSLMTNTKVVNQSAPRNRFRVRIKIGVAYGSDIDRVQEVLLTIARDNKMVAFLPDPRVRFRQFGDSALEFELLCWARRPEDRGRMVHELNQQIYRQFAAAGIEIPFPQRDVHLKPQPKDSEKAAS